MGWSSWLAREAHNLEVAGSSPAPATMRTLRPVNSADVLAIATAAASLGLPPTTYAIVPAWWHEKEVVPEIELMIWTDVAAVALTAAKLYGGRLHAFTFADITLASVTNATNTVTKATAHNLFTGDGPINFQSGGTYPTGLSATADYWFIKTGANTGKLAASIEDALAGVAVDFSTDGSGTLKLIAQAGTKRVHWETHDGLLGLAGDGAVALTSQVGYSKRIPHSPLVVAYALDGTLDTGSLSAAVAPIQDAGGF